MPVKYHARHVSFGVVAVIALTLLNWSVAQAQTTNYTLGTTARLEGPGSGLDSVVLGVTPSTGTWTATSNASWLHLSPANQSGTGSTNVIFSYDANPGTTRCGTLTIAGQTVTVTQAGSTYIPAQPLTTLVQSQYGSDQEVGYGYGLAVDASGNVYIADMGNAAIDYTFCKVEEWIVSNNTLITFPIPSSPIYPPPGILYPQTVAVDGSGNLYIGDIGNSGIWKWTVTNSVLTAVIPPGVYGNGGNVGVAVDGPGNVYFTDGGNYLDEWIAASNTVTTLVSSGLDDAAGVALDGAGNVYIADSDNYVIKEWNAATHAVATVGLPAYQPQGVAVDGAGNVYYTDNRDYYDVKEWIAASNTVVTLAPDLNDPVGVAVDGAGNVYIGVCEPGALLKLPHAFVDPTPRAEKGTAGNDSLPTVLPASENLLPPSAPSSDQSWLMITGITNGVVSFSFTANTGPARTAHITLLGQSIPITQAAPIIGTPPRLTSLSTVGNGTFQFSFTNTPGANFTVRSTTNLALPLNQWTVAGNPVENPSGTYQFTSQPITNNPQLFFDVSSP